jgi:hypothetical protein
MSDSIWGEKGEKFKDGRHVGLDFYDLLIEALYRKWRGAELPKHGDGAGAASLSIEFHMASLRPQQRMKI